MASPRVAAQDAADCKPGSADGAMLAKGFYGILAACGCEAASGRGERRNAFPVKADGQDEQPADEMEHRVPKLLDYVDETVHLTSD